MTTPVSLITSGAVAAGFSQIYVAIAGIIVLPFYLQYLGSEAYGLVSFFALLLAWSQFLDAGATATLIRESARFRGGAVSVVQFLGLYRVVSEIFFVIAVLIGVGVIALSGFIASQWLEARALSTHTLSVAVSLMGLTLPVRWLAGLYRGVLLGFEQLRWLSIFNFLVATIRLFVVIPILAIASSPVLAFFWFQLTVSILETAALWLAAGRHLPSAPATTAVASRRTSLRNTVAFSLSMGFATIAWLLVTQVDKVFVSATAPLTEYGRFSLATLLAGSIGIVAAPLSQIVLPRLTRLVAENSRQEALALYRRATQVLCAITAPLSITLVIFASPALFVLTGDRIVAESMSPTLALYAAGNGILVIAAMPYFLQYADGDLRLHVMGTGILALFMTLAMVFAIPRIGVLGAGICWLSGMVLYLVFWTPIAHRQFARGLEIPWLLFDVGISSLPSVSVAILAWLLISWPQNRVWVAATLTSVFCVALVTSVCSSNAARSLVFGVARSLRRPSSLAV